LRLDLGRAFIASAVPFEEATTPAAANLYKRVLVLLNQDTVPDDLKNWGWTRIVDRTFTAKVPLQELSDLAKRPEIKYVEAGRTLAPTLDTSLPETRANLVHNAVPPAPAFDGSGVVVGVIDYGCDFTLDDFRNPDGT